jgi:small conductance mechanosensitive channel
MNPNSAWNWIGPILMAILYGVVSWIVYHWVELIVGRRTRRRWTLWNDILASSLGWPLVLLLVLGGLVMLFALWPVAPATRAFYHGLERIVLIVALVLFIQQIFIGVYRASPRGSWLRIALLRRVLLVTLYVVAGLMVGQTLGLPMTAPILALAIVALVFGLASRDLLANFIAGIRLANDKPIAAGQTIRLGACPGRRAAHPHASSGEVVRIGWMRTWLRSADGGGVSIPNALLLESTIQSDYPGGPGATLVVTLAISRAADLDDAERLALDVARRVAVTPPELGADFDVRAAYTRLTATAAELTVTLRAPNPHAADAVRGAYLKAVHEAFSAAGIELV